jgi:hypothetical protein
MKRIAATLDDLYVLIDSYTRGEENGNLIVWEQLGNLRYELIQARSRARNLTKYVDYAEPEETEDMS